MSKITTIKLSGADWKRFYKDPAVWGENTHWDDGYIEVDGKHFPDIDGDNVADGSVVKVDGGYILEGLPGVPDDLVECIQWWLQRQTHQSFLLTVPKDKVQAATDALLALGLVMESI